MLSFLLIINNEVSIGFSLLLTSISDIISSGTINTFLFFVELGSLDFKIHHHLFVNNQ